MIIDNYVNDLMTILSPIGLEYDLFMSKYDFQYARNEIKHFIQNGGRQIPKVDYHLFEDYCRQVFEKYLPEVV